MAIKQLILTLPTITLFSKTNGIKLWGWWILPLPVGPE